MSIRDEMEQRLRDNMDVQAIEIVDESEAHRGHAGFREGGESHFAVSISAAGLDGLSRLERHRAVHAALGADIMGRIHALRISFL